MILIIFIKPGCFPSGFKYSLISRIIFFEFLKFSSKYFFTKLSSLSKL